MKWFLYSFAFSAFVWFVFFKPVDYNTSLATQSNNEEIPEELDTYTDMPGKEEEEITYDIDHESIEDTMQIVNEETSVIDFPLDVIDNTAGDYTDSENINSINLNKRYLIVVGSFGVKSNANRMLRKLKEGGSDGIITTIRGLHRVVMASTDDKTEAISLRLQFTEPAFILRQ